MTGAISFAGDNQQRIVDDEFDENGTNLTGVNLNGAIMPDCAKHH
jgi:hypothetical protein